MNDNDIIKAWRAYIEAALWTSVLEPEDGKDNGEPMDGLYNIDDITDKSKAAMLADVTDFITGCERERPDVFDGMSPEQIGHDFWLTRNHHGAGFWDRGDGERGDYLTKMSHPYGDADLYVGDDGEVHYTS